MKENELEKIAREIRERTRKLEEGKTCPLIALIVANKNLFIRVY